MISGVRRPGVDALIGLCLAGVLVLLALTTTGGFDQSITVSAADTWADIVITLLGAGACAAMLVFGRRGRAWGALTVALFAALTAWTALSILWSVQPDDSWQATNLTIAYLAAFAGAASLARIAPERWRALVGAVALATVVLAGYGLLSKVFPAAGDQYGRLQSPLGYWNATGAIAAMGLAPCLWAWTRRDSGPILRGLAVPGAAVLISVVVLSYSRTSVVIAVIAVACWLAVVPRRLSCALMLALSAIGAAVISGWALSRPALTSDNQPLSLRAPAGHTFGVVLLVCVLALTAAGIAAAVASDRVAVPAAVRRRIGAVLLIGVALLPVLGVVGLAESSRGLTGEISHAWTSLTSIKATVATSAARLGELGSSRPLYWHEGINVADHALLKGVGALGFATARARYNPTRADVVVHAHSFVVQTFADLGLIGLAISLALLIAWGVEAARAVAFGRRWAAFAPDAVAEREGLIALLLVAIGFGVDSGIDWTWYFQAVTVPALLCAGWLVGRGPLLEPVGRAARGVSILARPAIGAAVTALAAVALVCCWLIWQPLRSAQALASAENDVANQQLRGAFADAHSAVDSDPLAVQPLFVLSALYQSTGNMTAARAQLVRAVRLQPDNPVTWLQLGTFDWKIKRQLLVALPSLQRAYELDPTDPTIFDTITAARSEQAAGG